MAVERTFSIIKPDATRRNLTGKINARFEEKGLRIVAQRRIRMSRQQAEQFYGVHKARPFFNDLCTFMTSGPVVVQVLEGEDAIAKNREIMGATNPANAAAGTIRKDFAESIEANSVHGSDSPENAAIEIAYFFRRLRDRRLTASIARRTKKRPSGPLFLDVCAGGVSSGRRRPPAARLCRRCRAAGRRCAALPTRPSAMHDSSSTMNRIVNSTSLLNEV